MSVLVDSEIRRAYNRGAIVIEPFAPSSLGTNSYDVHLAKMMKVYAPKLIRTLDAVHHLPEGVIQQYGVELDCHTPNATTEIEIPDEGYVLQPNVLYLASTIEYTESREYLPLLNGKSSIGRLGLSIHVTAGTGDVGFKGHWTMELFVIHPLRVYAGMAIGQLLWLDTKEMPDVSYDLKKSAKYNNNDPLPQASKMHEEVVIAPGLSNTED